MKLAVYGTLKKGFPNHHFLDGAEFLGLYITEPTFDMYSFGSFPAVTLNGNTAIHCEVYEVKNLSSIKRIFRLEGYTGQRGSKQNFYDIHMLNTPMGNAWLFYIKEQITYSFPKRKKINSGIWN